MQNFRALGAPPPDPQNSPTIVNFWLRACLVKPALEKHLSEETDAGMQRLLQIGKLKICGPPFHVSILKG